MRETFCVGILETDGEKIVKGMFIYIFFQAILFPVTVLLNVSNLLLLSVMWIILKYIPVGIENIDVLFMTLLFIALYINDIKKVLNQISYALLIILTGSLVLKWVARGYLQEKSFRQAIIENDELSDFVVAITGFMERKYTAKFDHVQRLYMNSKSDEGMKQLKDYMSSLEKENKERYPYIL